MKKISELEKMSKAELMQLAKEVNLSGRSKLNKAELVNALSQIGNSNSKGSPAKKPGHQTKESILRSELSYKVRKRTDRPPDTFQEEVERGRFDLGVAQEVLPEPMSPVEELPQGYGDDRIVLMVRDPYWIYSYWEINESTVNQVLTQHQLTGHYVQKVIRLYFGEEANYQDIDVEGLLNNWFINVGQPNTELFADFGIRVQDQFIALVRSNRVRTPRAGMSEEVDEKWMTLEEEWKTIYALSGGLRMGEGSLGLQEMMEKRLFGEISSGAISSFFGSGKFREKARGFWCNLDAELIVYGATEPDAKVSLQGRPIQLRPDGTFTARFALPDGKQEIPVTFVSSDEIDRVTIIPKVVRKTEGA